MKRADMIIAALCLFVSGAFAVESLKLGYMAEFTPGSGFFPLWLAIALAIASLILLVQSVMRREENGSWLPDREGLKRVLLLAGATVVSVFLMPYIGMLLAIGLFMLFLMLTIEKHSWLGIIGVSALTPLVIYLVFQRWLLVPLPIGVFGF
ncbi:MAG: tripartite tricarboxylate transporter TctB family protein [Syntrophothermus sp.]